MRAALFHNSNAGEGHPNEEDLIAALRDAGYEVAHFSKDSAAAFAGELARGPDLVVMAGGDGTVTALLSCLAAVASPIAILPMGTSNNIARSFGLDSDPVELIPRLADAPEKRLDIGLANGPWGARLFMESVGWGLLANTTKIEVTADSVAERRLRMRATLVGALKKAKPRRMTLVVDGEEIEDEFLLVEATNIARVGPGLPLAEGETADADRLALVTLSPGDRDAMVDWLTDDKDAAPVKIRKARSIAVDWHRQAMRIDDEVEGKAEEPVPVLLRRLPVSLRLKVPKRGKG